MEIDGGGDRVTNELRGQKKEVFALCNIYR